MSTPTRYFKCIDNSGWGQNYLDLGHVYEGEVRYEGCPAAELTFIDKQGHKNTGMLKRFVEVLSHPGTKAAAPSEKPLPEAKPGPTAEYLFFAAVPDGCCPCGANKAKCRYHGP